jgi:hypothetical protein
VRASLLKRDRLACRAGVARGATASADRPERAQGALPNTPLQFDQPKEKRLAAFTKRLPVRKSTWIELTVCDALDERSDKV